MDINEAVKFFDLNELSRSKAILDGLILSDHSDLQVLLLRAKVNARMQRWGEAMNDYLTILELVPDHAEAKTGFEMAKSILGYFTPDMFNP